MKKYLVTVMICLFTVIIAIVTLPPVSINADETTTATVKLNPILDPGPPATNPDVKPLSNDRGPITSGTTDVPASNGSGNQKLPQTSGAQVPVVAYLLPILAGLIAAGWSLKPMKVRASV